MLIEDGIVFANESDVEQKLIYPLLIGEAYLGIPQEHIYTKTYLAPAVLDKAAGKVGSYVPDYAVWFYGLPTMIVEAKAPDVPAEVGYREASLYARHLNQRFPSGVNPCSCLISTNGKALLFGPWDSDPTLTLTLPDLRVGAYGLEQLQGHCSSAALKVAAESLSERLRSHTLVLPYDLLGGLAVLNARRPLNTFAADLSPILRLYFSSTPQENIVEIAAKAYVSSNEITEYDRILESLLRERLAFREDGIVRALQPTRRGETNIAGAISSFDKTRPAQGQLQIVQGPVGSGKSLFMRRYKEVLQPEDQAARTRWAFIDFNTATKADLANLESWIWRVFVDAFQPENPSIDLTSSNVLRGVFSRNLQRRKPIYEEVANASQSEAALLRANDLAKWHDDPREMARGIADYIVGNRREILVTVMDNVDRLDLESQLNAFQATLSFMAATRSFVILQMRDETYERYKDRPPLDTYRSSITFHISPPRFIDVVKKRLELSFEHLTAEAAEVQRYTLESGMRITYPKSHVGLFLRELYLELFERRHNISRIMEALAGLDVRRALEMFVSVITSGHLSTSAITSNVMGAGAIPIREHNILKILMRTEYRFASDQSGFIINLLRCEKEWVRPDNFILIEILYFLNVNRKLRGEIGIEGYFTCRRVADELQHFGYVPEDVLAGLNYLLRKQLIAADHLNFAAVNFDDSVRILASGHIHVRILPERLEYLYGILPTTPINDKSVAERISRILQRENQFDSVPISDKAYAVRVLLGYLEREAARLRSQAPLPPPESRGAQYWLTKMQRCLNHVRTQEWPPNEPDPLDV